MRKHLTEEQRQERNKQREERNKQLEAYGKQIEQIVSDRGKRIAKRLKDTRKEKGYTQQEFAILLGISKDSLMDYEKTGELKYSTRVFLSMCEALDCSPQYLMGIDNCYHRETTDIHRLTGLSELAIEYLLCRRVGAIQWGYSLSTEDHLVLSDFISYLITHIDEHLLINYVESSAYYEIGKQIIEDAINHGHEDDVRYPKSEISRDTKFHENSAFRIKTELGDKFKLMLEEWEKGRIEWDVERYNELSNVERKWGSHEER